MPDANGSSARGEPRRIGVVVVDDHELVREGIVALLERETDIDLIASYQNAEEAIRGLRPRRKNVDVAVIDQRLPGMPGVEACERFLAGELARAVIMLTSFSDEEVLRAAILAGASGYLTKDVATTDLAGSIRDVVAGRLALTAAATSHVVVWARHGARSLRPCPLADRDADILRLVGRGLSNAEIGTALHLSTSAVKKHLGLVMRQLGVARRWDAVAAGRRKGLI